MKDVDFYSVLNQLWPATISAIKTPNDALVIGNVGNEIARRLEISKRPPQPKAEVPPSDGKGD